MDRFYQNLWLEGGVIAPENPSETVKSPLFSAISVLKSKSDNGQFDYITVRFFEELFHNEPLQKSSIKAVADSIRFFLKKYGIERKNKVLVVGLGNENVTADSLGARIVDKLYVTSHLYEEGKISGKYGNLCGFKSSVSGVTGLASFDIITALIERTKPDILFCIDTLACGSSNNLANIIQLTDCGIEPGGGVGNPKQKLNHQSLGVPVIAIGVPLVIYVNKILAECADGGTLRIPDALKQLVVTAKEIDFQISDYSYVIGEGINAAMHGSKQ